MKLFFAGVVCGAVIALGVVRFVSTKDVEERPPGIPMGAGAPTAAAPRSMPMHVRVDAIDLANSTFTTRRKDGVEIKTFVTDRTQIKNHGVDATFADVQVGDMVSGSRVKRSETEYEVLKIAKFGQRSESPRTAQTDARDADDSGH